ncbi:hypothetical protein [Capnocytophaga bilenii]|uniref:hypothetical protein n=1 Tax=Capnocytophaga bilenii TaxID=2819369 RepID=UPI0028D0301D|nr:hypothetical protein [Capnocytophaga bilenii]
MALLNTKLDIRTDVKWAFTYFAIVVLLGIFMRSATVVAYPFTFNYRNIVHTHSHLALLGWVYVLLSALLVRTFIRFPQKNIDEVGENSWGIRIVNRRLFNYRLLFYITQFSVLGMLFSFPFQGYGAVSISFSSVFIICTYIFARFYFKHSEKDVSLLKRAVKGEDFVKMGVFYLVLSSIGIWLMPVMIVKFGKYSDMYMCAIAFFLHFQYNGWMLSSLMGLFIKKYGWAERYPELLKKVFIGFHIGIIGTLFVSWLGYFGYSIYYVVGAVSALMWLAAVCVIGYLYLKHKEQTLLASIFIGAFAVKVLLMLIGTLPVLTQYLFTNMDLLITYLHFNFLGIITIGLFLFLEEVYKVNRYLLYIYLFAFFSTELLITYKGFAIVFQYPILTELYDWLFVATALFYLPAIGWRIGCYKIKYI